MAWWKERPMRLIQNNLRDIDAQMDVDSLLKTLREFSCNTLMVGAGGITSFYPTQLAYQRPSPYLHGRDLLGEIIEKCHREDIRVIARFDFSKTHESFFDGHPEWYYLSGDGQRARYNDTVHTCINGWYQQQYSLEVLREVLSRYPVDGIFFNMFGFTTSDYSNRYYGICRCDACKERFAAFSGGMELPEREETADMDEAEALRLRTYRRFQREVTADILHRIHTLVRSFGEDIAVCTYYDKDVDIIRNESNSAVDRPLPFLLRQSSVNVQTAVDLWPDKVSSNCVINAADIFYRFSGVSPQLTKTRLYEDMAAGGALDYCIIGVFDGYPDKAGVAAAKEIFRFHKDHEDLFWGMKPMAKTVVLRPSGYGRGLYGEENFLGIFRVLKEAHIPFTLCSDEQIMRGEAPLSPKKLVIIPNLSDVSEDAVIALHRSKIPLLICGAERIPKSLEKQLGIRLRETQTDTRASYFSAEGEKEQTMFPEIAERGWVLLDRAFGVIDAPGWEKLLPQVEKAWFGPPERCFGHKRTETGGVLRSPDGKTVLVPWQIGALYRRLGYEDYRYILAGLVKSLCPEASLFPVQAPDCAEIFWNKTGKGLLLQVINLSGFDGMTFSPPLAVPVRVQLPGSALQARLLTPEGTKQSTVVLREGVQSTELELTCTGRYAAVLLESWEG